MDPGILQTGPTRKRDVDLTPGIECAGRICLLYSDYTFSLFIFIISRIVYSDFIFLANPVPFEKKVDSFLSYHLHTQKVISRYSVLFEV